MFAVLNHYTREELFAAPSRAECEGWILGEAQRCNCGVYRCWRDLELNTLIYDIGWTVCYIAEK